MKPLFYILCILLLGTLVLFLISLLLPPTLVLDREIPLRREQHLVKEDLEQASFTSLFYPHRVVFVDREATFFEVQPSSDSTLYVLYLTQKTTPVGTQPFLKLRYMRPLSQASLWNFKDRLYAFYNSKRSDQEPALSLLAQKVGAYIPSAQSHLFRDTLASQVRLLVFKEQVKEQDLSFVLSSLLRQTNATLRRYLLDTLAYTQFYYRLYRYSPYDELSQLELVSLIRPEQEEVLKKVGIVRSLSNPLLTFGNMTLKASQQGVKFLDSLVRLYEETKHLKKMIFYREALYSLDKGLGHRGEAVLGIGYAF